LTSQIPAYQKRRIYRLSELLEKQRESEMVGDEPQELEALMQIYNEG
jgi:hypothetical protein